MDQVCIHDLCLLLSLRRLSPVSTRPGKALKIIVVRVDFPALNRPHIPIDSAEDGKGGLSYTMDMNAQLYRDMSWGKIDWESTYAPKVRA